MKVDIIMSVDSDAFEIFGGGHYDTTLSIIGEVKRRGHTLFLVYPTEYDLSNAPSMKRVMYFPYEYRLRERAGPGRETLYYFAGPRPSVALDDETPEAGVFLIYGTEEMSGKMDGRHEEHYSFLKDLKDSGKIGKFLNDPEAERKTVKDAMCRTYDGIPTGRTYMFETRRELMDALKEEGVLVKKPVFGCMGRGVEPVYCDSKDLPDDGEIGMFVFQELLEGQEKRIILFNKQLLTSRIIRNRKHPWEQSSGNGERMGIYDPTKRELRKSIEMMEALGLEIGAVDWIGDKINEVNGSGTGLVKLDERGAVLYDHTAEIVDYIEQYL